jgi:hypothetical protein
VKIQQLSVMSVLTLHNSLSKQNTLLAECQVPTHFATWWLLSQLGVSFKRLAFERLLAPARVAGSALKIVAGI